LTGTTPEGAKDEQQASRFVQDMFGRVAPRYDFANHLLSFNIDRSWRNRTVDRVRDVLGRPHARVLDLCCGTGDLTIALSRERGRPAIGSDFCHPMLIAAGRKSRCPLFEADALALPLEDASIDLITCAFGFRNLANYDAGLREFRRVLRPAGKVAILEFSQPPNKLFAGLYDFYSRYILPTLGGWISGAPNAYRYLPASVRKFPGPEELAERMRGVNFENVTFERWTGGIVALHVGRG
jgi:demethylmenaquinone methyltransferase/2-methoxy-6-polyprenyl-1,4-benzoquinol methylase